MVIPAEFFIIGLVLTVLNVLDQLLKRTTGNNTINHIRKRIKFASHKIEESVNESNSDIPLDLLSDLVENLIDLSTKLTFDYVK